MSEGVRLFGVDNQGIVVELYTEGGCEFPTGVVHAWDDARLPFKTKGCRQFVRVSAEDPYEEEYAGTLRLDELPERVRARVGKLRVAEPDDNGLLEPNQVKWTGAGGEARALPAASPRPQPTLTPLDRLELLVRANRAAKAGKGGRGARPSPVALSGLRELTPLPADWESYEDDAPWTAAAHAPLPALDPALLEQPLRAEVLAMADVWLDKRDLSLTAAFEALYPGRGEALTHEVVEGAIATLDEVDLRLLGYRALHPDAASFSAERVGAHLGLNRVSLPLREREITTKVRTFVDAAFRRRPS